MTEIARALACAGDRARDPGSLLGREWLVTNGLGGYASGTLAGMPRAAITACSSRPSRRRSAGW